MNTAIPQATARLPAASAGWAGHLSLSLERRGAKTAVTRRRHGGPLLIQRPFYPEGGSPCHIYLLHPPGGLVGGDQLALELDLGRDAQALVTTPSAGKVYRVSQDGREQGQRNDCKLAEGATLEWLPQECIAFNGARARIDTRVSFELGSTLIGWDMLCLGRPACDERFERGRVEQRLELWCQGRPRLIERANYDAGEPVMTARWGLQGRPVVGTLFCYWPGGASDREQALNTARQLLQADTGAAHNRPLLAATLVNDILLVRYLGFCSEHCRQSLSGVWEALRPLVLSRQACTPRIWNT